MGGGAVISESVFVVPEGGAEHLDMWTPAGILRACIEFLCP